MVEVASNWWNNKNILKNTLITLPVNFERCNKLIMKVIELYD